MHFSLYVIRMVQNRLKLYYADPRNNNIRKSRHEMIGR